MELKPKTLVSYRIDLLLRDSKDFLDAILDLYKLQVKHYIKFPENYGEKEKLEFFKIVKPLWEHGAEEINKKFFIANTAEEKEYFKKVFIQLMTNFTKKENGLIVSFKGERQHMFNDDDLKKLLNPLVEVDFENNQIIIKIKGLLSKNEIKAVGEQIEKTQIFFYQIPDRNDVLNRGKKGFYANQELNEKLLEHNLKMLKAQTSGEDRVNLKKNKKIVERYLFLKNKISKEQKLKPEENEEFEDLKIEILKKDFFKAKGKKQGIDEDLEILRISEKYKNEKEGEEYYKRKKIIKAIKDWNKDEKNQNKINEKELGKLGTYDKIYGKYIIDEGRKELRGKLNIKDYHQRLQQIKKQYFLS